MREGQAAYGGTFGDIWGVGGRKDFDQRHILKGPDLALVVEVVIHGALYVRIHIVFGACSAAQNCAKRAKGQRKRRERLTCAGAK